MARKLASLLFFLLMNVGMSWGDVPVIFENVAESVGADDPGMSYTVCFNDYDGDGQPDLIIGNGDKPNLLLKNIGGSFVDVTLDSGIFNEEIGMHTWVGSSAVLFDYDNDGDLDIYFAIDANGQAPEFKETRNYLYRNESNGIYTDATLEAGVPGPVWGSIGAVVADYDNDGFIDIYVLDHGDPNILYKNNGDGTFTDSTKEAGVEAGTPMNSTTLAAFFFDADGDGDLDLYAVNVDYGIGIPSYFYLNKGDGTFEDFSRESNLDAPGDPTGAAIGDYDNDGDLDIFVANYFLPNRLFRNQGNGRFEDVAEEAGVDMVNHIDADPPSEFRGAEFVDFDNDGNLDLIVARDTDSPLVYRNIGNGTFEDITGTIGMDKSMRPMAFASADYDLDGDLDLYFANSYPNRGQSNALYRNNGGNSAGNWLQVQVKSREHLDGIGTKIRLAAGGSTQYRQIIGGSGLSHSWLVTHFGLGELKLAENIEVIFPSGVKVTTPVPVKANQIVVVSEDGFENFISAVVKTEELMPVSWANVKRYALLQNYPNPFNPETWIPFSLAEKGHVVLSIHNSAGELVREIDLGHLESGEYLDKNSAAYWDGRNEEGSRVSSGVYFYTIRANDFTATGKMLILK